MLSMAEHVESVLRRAELDATRGVHFAAAVSLGGALVAAEEGGWRSVRAEVLRRCHMIRALLNAEAVLEHAERTLDRIGRIVSVGNKLNDDEWTLVLTMRIQVGLSNIALMTLASTSPLWREDAHDTRLTEVARHPVNRAVFRSSISGIQRHWRKRIPFDVGRVLPLELSPK